MCEKGLACYLECDESTYLDYYCAGMRAMKETTQKKRSFRTNFQVSYHLQSETTTVCITILTYYRIDKGYLAHFHFTFNFPISC